MELIDKQPNGFGDMNYYIRDSSKKVHVVHECQLTDFMKKHGITEFREGMPYLYAPRSKR